MFLVFAYLPSSSDRVRAADNQFNRVNCFLFSSSFADRYSTYYQLSGKQNEYSSGNRITRHPRRLYTGATGRTRRAREIVLSDRMRHGVVVIDNVARCLPTTDWTAEEAGARPCAPIPSASGTRRVYDRQVTQGAVAAVVDTAEDSFGPYTIIFSFPYAPPPITITYPNDDDVNRYFPTSSLYTHTHTLVDKIFSEFRSVTRKYLLVFEQ